MEKPEAPAAAPARQIELNAHDVTRIWNLAVAIYDGDDEDADLRNYFARALNIYFEFFEDLTVGGIVFEDEERGQHYVSSREWRPEGDIVRFTVVPIEKKEKGKDKKKKDKAEAAVEAAPVAAEKAEKPKEKKK